MVLVPPATSTVPLPNKVAVWPTLATLMLPVAANTPCSTVVPVVPPVVPVVPPVELVAPPVAAVPPLPLPHPPAPEATTNTDSTFNFTKTE